MRHRRKLAYIAVNEVNQSDGFNENELDPMVKSRLYNSHIRSKLYYGIDNMILNKANKKELKKTEGAIIKDSMGIHHRTRTTPLLNALGISTTEDNVIKIKTNLFMRLLNNEYVSELIKTILKNGELAADSLIKEIKDITHASNITEIENKCKNINKQIKKKVKERMKTEEAKYLNSLLRKLPQSKVEILEILSAYEHNEASIDESD